MAKKNKEINLPLGFNVSVSSQRRLLLFWGQSIFAAGQRLLSRPLENERVPSIYENVYKINKPPPIIAKAAGLFIYAILSFLSESIESIEMYLHPHFMRLPSL